MQKGCQKDGGEEEEHVQSWLKEEERRYEK